MVTMNYTGSEKSKLLVIGKSAKPRGFPKNMKHFPVNYENTYVFLSQSPDELNVFVFAFTCFSDQLVVIPRLLL